MSFIAKNIQLVAITSIRPWERNPRTHSQHQVELLAKAILEFGFTTPVLMRSDGSLVAGHGRVEAAKLAGLTEVPAIYVDHLSERQVKALVIADNKIASLSGWDFQKLSEELNDLVEMEFDLELTGFDEQEIDTLLRDDEFLPSAFTNPPAAESFQRTAAPPKYDTEVLRDGNTEADENVDQLGFEVSVSGDIWNLDGHRVMCGDSTNAEHVASLMGGQIAVLLHADPPYGMGKVADGVANDNLYNEKLDAFQMAWWKAWRPHIVSNGSAYIWGNAEELWRLWFVGGLKDTEVLSLRNEIVWDKKSIPGMASELMTQFATATERCLFIQLGSQFIGNINTGDFPDQWEPLRFYMESQAVNAGVRPQDIKEVCGCQMYQHWFTKSQFVLIPERHYNTLAKHYPGHFLRPWSDLKREWDIAREVITSRRSYFNKSHDPMRDVWEFSRVIGDERYGHATPKPVAMMERIMKSSAPVGGIVVEPFAGSGSTLIGAERTGRLCYTMELQPIYVDTTVRRWQNFTGKSAVHAITGKTFDETMNERK